jgi:4-hydroxyacetophenone monooxygenase
MPSGGTLTPDALATGDVRVLLMGLYHLTGDRRWLEPPYRPRRDVRLIADPNGGLDPGVAAAVREAVWELVAGGVPPVAVTDPGPTLAEMLSVCLGEGVPDEYVSMMRQDMGFVDGRVGWTGARPPTDRYDVLIVGAGFSGLAMGARCEQLGLRYTIVDRHDSVGGTWVQNRYPGVRVDTPNHFYAFSTLPHPWAANFSPGSEIAAYARRCADELGVNQAIRLGTDATAARWDGEARRWEVALSGPTGVETVTAAFLVAAVGHFNEPQLPSIDGLDRFDGPVIHTAAWPADDGGLDGRDVAVIGTGASAMQVVPAIVDRVRTLTIYQRTPQWVREVPRYFDAVPPGVQALRTHLPYYAQWERFTLFWRFGDGLLRSLRKDPDWPHPERSLNRANDRHREEMAAYVERQLAARPELIPHCVPSYPPYGKRILLDNGWYEALVRDHVALVPHAVTSAGPGGITAADGVARPADVLICATGYRVTRLAAAIPIAGAGGRLLSDDWGDDNPTAHLGITVPGFPNFFTMYGPNTNMGHGGSGPFLAECQSRYIATAITAVAERGARSLDVRPQARDRFVAAVDAGHAELVWTHPGVSTYYRNRHGRVVSTMPFRLVDYWAMTSAIDLDDYVIC